MTDDWFDEYMFRLVVEKKYVPEKVLNILKQKPIRLRHGTLCLLQKNDEQISLFIYFCRRPDVF